MTPTSEPSDPRVIRGGCWLNDKPSWVRAARRGTNEPAYRDSYIGFRTALAGRMKR